MLQVLMQVQISAVPKFKNTTVEPLHNVHLWDREKRGIVEKRPLVEVRMYYRDTITFSVCRLMVTEFLEQMKKTNRREDVPRGYALEDLEDPDKSIHYEKS